MAVKNRLADLLPEITEWRHDLHRHPELMYDLPRTAARVAELCRAFGCDEVVEGVGRSGVVAVIHGAEAGGAIGLRADMDALPIHEITGLDYASQTDGVMHACGHDGHTAILLGAAKYLAETRNFAGRVICIFQPAEEGGGGGLAMLRDGLMQRWPMDEVYGLHNMPGVALGTFAIREGAIMAAADQFEILVKGKGGHAARPQDAIDTTLVAAQIVIALQSVVSRNVDPLANAVVTLATFESDSRAYNVIAQEVTMKGTVRVLDPAIQDHIIARIEALVHHTAAAYGAEAVLQYHRGYPVTVNPPEQTRIAIEVAEAVSGAAVLETDPLMAAEDFSYMLNACPGAYIFLGNGVSEPLHHPAYVFDDAAIPFGASWFVGLVEKRLSRGA